MDVVQNVAAVAALLYPGLPVEEAVSLVGALLGEEPERVTDEALGAYLRERLLAQRANLGA